MGGYKFEGKIGRDAPRETQYDFYIAAQDKSGNYSESNSITIHHPGIDIVSPEGMDLSDLVKVNGNIVDIDIPKAENQYDIMTGDELSPEERTERPVKGFVVRLKNVPYEGNEFEDREYWLVSDEVKSTIEEDYEEIEDLKSGYTLTAELPKQSAWEVEIGAFDSVIHPDYNASLFEDTFKQVSVIEPPPTPSNLDVDIDETHKTPSTPTRMDFDQRQDMDIVVSWNPPTEGFVERYEVTSQGETFETESTSFIESFQAGTDLNVEVKAVGGIPKFNLNWDEIIDHDIEEFIVRYREEGESAWSTHTTETNQASFELEFDIEYEFQIKAVGDNFLESPWKEFGTYEATNKPESGVLSDSVYMPESPTITDIESIIKQFVPDEPAHIDKKYEDVQNIIIGWEDVDSPYLEKYEIVIDEEDNSTWEELEVFRQKSNSINLVGLSADSVLKVNVFSVGQNRLRYSVDWGSVSESDVYELRYRSSEEGSWSLTESENTETTVRVEFDEVWEFETRVITVDGIRSNWSTTKDEEESEPSLPVSEESISIEVDVPEFLRDFVDNTEGAWENMDTLLNAGFYDESSIWDEDFNIEEDGYSGEHIRAKTIETQALAVGSRYRDFSLEGVTFEPNYQDDNQKLNITFGYLIRISAPDDDFEDEQSEWTINETTVDVGSSDEFWVYARCEKEVDNANIEYSTSRPPYDDGDYYNFVIGILDTTSDPATFASSYGFTFIDGDKITTGTLNANNVNVIGGDGTIELDSFGLRGGDDLDNPNFEIDTDGHVELTGSITITSGSTGLSNLDDANMDNLDDGEEFGRVKQTYLDAGEIKLTNIDGTLDDIEDGDNYAKLSSDAIADGKALLSEAVGNLDDINEGDTYGRVRLTQLTDGRIQLVEAEGDLDDIEDGSDYGKVSTVAIDAEGYIKLAEAVGSLDDIDGAGDLKDMADTPSGAGLFLSTSHLGYYDDEWNTYMTNQGEFYLGGENGSLQWDGNTLEIDGNAYFGGELTAASGRLGDDNYYVDFDGTNLDIKTVGLDISGGTAEFSGEISATQFSLTGDNGDHWNDGGNFQFGGSNGITFDGTTLEIGSTVDFKGTIGTTTTIEGHLYLDHGADGIFRNSSIVVASSESSQAGKDGADYVCTGSNDQVQINNAINEMSDGGKVVLLEGTYEVDDSIEMKSNVTLEGQGESTSIIANGSDSIINANEKENITIRDIFFDAADEANHCILLEHNENININNCGIFHGASIGLYGINLNKVKINNCDFEKNGSNKEEHAGLDIAGESIIINNNTFVENASYGLVITIWDENPSDSEVVNNIFEKNGYKDYDGFISGSILLETDNILISNNVSESPYGVHITIRGAECTVTENFCRDRKNRSECGIFMAPATSTENNLVFNNDLYQSADDEIIDDGTDTIIRNNRLTGGWASEGTTPD